MCGGNIVLCSKCSHEIESDVPFCKYCGAKIEETEVVEKTTANMDEQSLNDITEENIKNLNKVAKIKKLFIKPTSKTIAFVASFVGILVVVSIVIVLVSSNPVNKFFNLLSDGK
jgi:uncharacterized membrane protein YvbJ